MLAPTRASHTRSWRVFQFRCVVYAMQIRLRRTVRFELYSVFDSPELPAAARWPKPRYPVEPGPSLACPESASALRSPVSSASRQASLAVIAARRVLSRVPRCWICSRSGRL